jgi:hypothetical protein
MYIFVEVAGRVAWNLQDWNNPKLVVLVVVVHIAARVHVDGVVAIVLRR